MLPLLIKIIVDVFLFSLKSKLMIFEITFLITNKETPTFQPKPLWIKGDNKCLKLADISPNASFTLS